jgi:hypothetical protein
MVGYTKVIQDGHRADQYPEVGEGEAIQGLEPTWPDNALSVEMVSQSEKDIIAAEN